MASMRHWVLLLFFEVLSALATSSAHGNGNLTLRCLPDQSATLLQLKKSFFFEVLSSDEDDLSTTKLQSWQDGNDCCLWEGVGCGGSAGHVIALDLNGRGLYSRGLDPVIFNLTSLQFLDLSMNNFYGYSIPDVGFERLTYLTHLNLSNSGFFGQIPVAIAKVGNLVSLDLSNHYGISDDDDDEISRASDRTNSLSLPNFQTLVRNLSNLRELYLDHVEIHSNGEELCKALARFVPRLRVLSLESCYLYGRIHESLSNLSSLTVINLQYNVDIVAGPFPQFFMRFFKLSVLRLADMNFEGRFPLSKFQSKLLKVLDLCGNMNLSGSLPSFSSASSVETLRLDNTNFSYAKPGSFRNFKSLKELSLDGKFIPIDFASSFSMLGSLSQLQRSRIPFSENFGELFSLIGDLRNLTKLELVECDLSSMKPYSISNLSLKSLNIFNCNLTMSGLSAVGNLIGLENLHISSCRVHGSFPPSIGNLTNLRKLYISDCGFLGLMPSSIGNLINLRNLNIYSTNFSGPIPSTFGLLKNLESLKMYDCKFTGPLPSTIGNLSNLRTMDIYNCEISGPIPSAFGFLRNLKVLSIFGCMFSGPIPYTVGKLKELKIARLVDNKFSGEIPNSIGNLTRLLTLDLSTNFLKGKIPASVFTLPILEHLDLSRNELSGPIEEFDVASSCLVELELDMNELSGEVPGSFFKIKSLELLSIESNNFVGSVDLSSIWKLPKLRGLGLSNNKLSVMDGAENNSSSTHPSRLVAFGLACCRITKFPSILAHTSDMLSLDLSCNNISGDIPNWIWERWSSSLTYLNLSHNMFIGTGLDSPVLPLGTPMQLLDLSSNSFYGSIDDQLVWDYFSSMQIVDLSSNKFSGNLRPEWFGQLKSMMAKFDSRGDTVLARNGSAPGGFYQNSVVITYKGSYLTFESILTTLTAMDFSNNSLEGTIPESVGQLVSLHVLNMSHNALTGKIPSQLGGMTDLESLDLSCNQLTGAIAQELTDLTFLSILNLSDNRLVGKIPQSRQFSTFENSSFEGNLGLCGPPLLNPCDFSPAPTSPLHVEKSSGVDIVFFLFVGLGFGVGFAAAILMRWGRVGEWFVKSARAMRT